MTHPQARGAVRWSGQMPRRAASTARAALLGIAAHAAALVAGCGSPPASPGVVPTLQMPATLAESTQSLVIYVFGRWRSDNVELTCNSIMTKEPGRRIEPDDSRLEQLGRRDLVFGPQIQTLTVNEIPPGKVVIVVEAEDQSGNVIGLGCADRNAEREDITVRSGATTTNVEVIVVPR